MHTRSRSKGRTTRKVHKQTSIKQFKKAKNSRAAQMTKTKRRFPVGSRIGKFFKSHGTTKLFMGKIVSYDLIQETGHYNAFIRYDDKDTEHVKLGDIPAMARRAAKKTKKTT